MLSRALLLALGLSICCAATAAEITGRVVKIADGDTITVLDAGDEQHRVRLAGIDAPEKKQPFRNASKHNLSALVAGQTVTVEFVKFDRYQRMVGKVPVNGVDVCLEQVRLALQEVPAGAVTRGSGIVRDDRGPGPSGAEGALG